MDAPAHNDLMKLLLDSSYLNAGNAEFIEQLYSEFLKDPDSIPTEWQAIFRKLVPDQDELSAEVDHQSIRQVFAKNALEPQRHLNALTCQPYVTSESKQVAVLQLINAYRFRGYQLAQTDPVRLRDRPEIPKDIDPAFHKLNDDDMEHVFNTGSFVGPRRMSLREIIRDLKLTYCGHIGAEYMHVTSISEKRWLQNRLESVRGQPSFTAKDKRNILERVVAAEGLEKYLHVKYVGQKRFSLEGAESLIPMLDDIIQRAGNHDIVEVVLGMAHRGRLNVLINLLGKSPQDIFSEFEGTFDYKTRQGSGDVKYHQGFSSDISTEKGHIHLTLAFNPSHLEIIGPVVQGSVRARQHRRKDTTGKKVLPVIIHGDAAFSGQGVVMEIFQMSEARGFTTGGTIHIIINNQIGFTTSHPLDARSTSYCTEVAKIVQAPIFHVNADDPEAVLFVTQLALDYRMEFSKDVVIDLECYRRHGHNEADEPKTTQPMMYKKINAHPTIVSIYGDKLVEEKVILREELDRFTELYREALEKEHTVAPRIMVGVKNLLAIDWEPYRNIQWVHPVTTSISIDTVQKLAPIINHIPEDYKVHASVEKIINNRAEMALGNHDIDWGFAELLAYASLLDEKYEIRISGQDSRRGTFFHRHAAIHNQIDGSTYIPLQHLRKDQPGFVVIDSLLSEEAVLAYEYGYATTDPNSLLIWEAQFGDFANGAQVVIDQFISSGEAKWDRLCGLIMFLPHGYDGQGPEHSSARLERYLQLCAEDNIQVCVPSVPAQIFHMLRRQMIRPMRRPLIVMTPKSLLRHKQSTSSLDDITNGKFHNVIGETDDLDSEKITCIVVCSGKIYFELLQARREREINSTAIIRIEQLYPFPSDEFTEQLQKFPNAKLVRWCQEEPRNQGAWRYIMKRMLDCMGSDQELSYATRPPSASPAVGYLQKHLEQQKAVVDAALMFELNPG